MQASEWQASNGDEADSSDYYSGSEAESHASWESEGTPRSDHPRQARGAQSVVSPPGFGGPPLHGSTQVRPPAHYCTAHADYAPAVIACCQNVRTQLVRLEAPGVHKASRVATISVKPTWFQSISRGCPSYADRRLCTPPGSKQPCRAGVPSQDGVRQDDAA